MPVVAHCPHCLLPMPGGPSLPYPPVAERCPNCRLLIAAGRARADVTGEDGEARARGSAAGVLANAARRTEGTAADPELVAAGLRRAATELGAPVERLRMLDYAAVSERAGDLADLATVLATFPTWKGARAAAAGRAPLRATGEDVERVA